MTRAVVIAGVALALTACTAARADEAGFELRIAPDLTVEQGANGAISVAIVPAAGRTVSADGPVRLAVSGPDAIGLPRRRYARKDAADPAADAPRFDVRVKAREPGDHAVALDVRFWLCGSRVCRPITVTRTVTVHVPAPAPPVDAAPPPIDAGVDAAPPRGRRR
ncbi:MAG TPA: hypothetical protein VM261_01675 [Kofleriaceae bacterium]|nr:hypothetical protein [Kofleriaceae bacterium]